MFLAAFCLMASYAVAYGQYPQVPVSISTEKVKIDGKVYYSHIVLEKQTLYSISKAYGVTVQDIYDANPALQTEGLKKNAIILIPSAQPAATAQTAQGTNPDNEISDAPAQDDNGSKAAKKNRRNREKVQDVYIVHTVRWFEDLDMISEKYGVPVDIIMEVNGLTGRKLTNRQKLKIPADLKAYLEERAVSQAQGQQQGGCPPQSFSSFLHCLIPPLTKQLFDIIFIQ